MDGDRAQSISFQTNDGVGIVQPGSPKSKDFQGTVGVFLACEFYRRLGLNIFQAPPRTFGRFWSARHHGGYAGPYAFVRDIGYVFDDEYAPEIGSPLLLWHHLNVHSSDRRIIEFIPNPSAKAELVIELDPVPAKTSIVCNGPCRRASDVELGSAIKLIEDFLEN